MLEKVFTVISFLLFMGGVIPSVMESLGLGQDIEQGNPVVQFSFFLIYIITILLSILRWKSTIYVATKGSFLWVLIGLAIISAFWSFSPSVTLRRSFALVGTSLFGLYLAVRYDLSEQLRLLAWSLGIAALLSLIVGLILPNYAIMTVGNEEEAWRGILIHKNTLGRLMALSALSSLILAMNSRQHKWLTWFSFGLSVILILLSTSKTALLVLLSSLAVLPLYRALRWPYTRILPLFITVILICGGTGTLLVDNAEPILNFLGRDITLTGRTQLWNAVAEEIREQPWLGYGYQGFWLGWEGPSYNVWHLTNWKPPHAHNAFLDLLLDLGVLGLTVFMLHLLKTLSQAILEAHQAKALEGIWPLLFLTFVLLYSLTESEGGFLKQNNIFWVLYVAINLSMAVKQEQGSCKKLFPKLQKKGYKFSKLRQ